MARPDYVDPLAVFTAADRAGFDHVVAALKPGIYIVCSRCGRFGQSDEISFEGMDGPLCAECA
jgi:hypothetical protein